MRTLIIQTFFCWCLRSFSLDSWFFWWLLRPQKSRDGCEECCSSNSFAVIEYDRLPDDSSYQWWTLEYGRRIGPDLSRTIPSYKSIRGLFLTDYCARLWRELLYLWFVLILFVCFYCFYIYNTFFCIFDTHVILLWIILIILFLATVLPLLDVGGYDKSSKIEWFTR